MRGRRAVLGALAVLALVPACGGGGDNEEADHQAPLTPTFPPLTATTSTVPAGAPDPTAPATSPASTLLDAVGPGPGGATVPTLEGGLTDRSGDLTLSLDPPPRWADLVGAHLVRRAERFELRVTLGGPAAPTSAGDDAHTMNVASFYDVDGDGYVDYEVWANLGNGGWGGSWFDDNRQHAAFGDDSQVAITVEGAELVLRFPLAHVADATAFRWSVASEWGRYEVIGTDLAARDDAPDGDAPVDFPS